MTSTTVAQSVQLKERAFDGSGIATERKPLLCKSFLLAADKAGWTKPVPVRRCHLHLIMTSSQWYAQGRKTDAGSSSSEWHEQKGKEESRLQFVCTICKENLKRFVVENHHSSQLSCQLVANKGKYGRRYPLLPAYCTFECVEVENDDGPSSDFAIPRYVEYGVNERSLCLCYTIHI